MIAYFCHPKCTDVYKYFVCFLEVYFMTNLEIAIGQCIQNGLKDRGAEDTTNKSAIDSTVWADST